MRATLLTALCAVAVAAPVHAQTSGRIRISVNVAQQVTSRSLDQSFSVPINVESAPITSSIDVPSAPLFDIGGSYRLIDRLSVGVAVSSLSRNVSASVDAQIPHPFFFNTLRPISGELTALQHKERAVHISALYVVPAGTKVDIGLFGGPSSISLKQDFVTDIDYTATYPYDAATFTGAPTETISKSVMGYNVGADVSYRLSPAVAVGGLIRFTGGSATITVGSGNDVDAKVGGLQAGGGIRFIF
jgi:hypothetical protein